MKIYIPKINESWIVDRFREEWYKNNPEISTKSILLADIIWIISPWMWQKVPKYFLKTKKVVCTYHHIVNSKFNKDDFESLDYYVDKYHVISNKTESQIRKLTKKTIFNHPFWVNQKLWFPINEKNELRKSFGFHEKQYLIGSFQRDTESHDLKSPKLEKGPDILFSIISKIAQENKNLTVVLTGKNRQFIINKFQENGIGYKYFEMIDLESINKLYNTLDMYVVSSRVEGGPQAILECAASKTPIISRDVGIASEILNMKSLFDKDFSNASPDTEYAYNSVKEFFIPRGMSEFISMFGKI
jgi:glycosyltransferase involved in cell wall biosynthesis